VDKELYDAALEMTKTSSALPAEIASKLGVAKTEQVCEWCNGKGKIFLKYDPENPNGLKCKGCGGTGKQPSRGISKEEIKKEIANSKIMTYAKKISRKLANSINTPYDDPKDKWLDSKANELAEAILKRLEGL
jgi:DnaJ-class molecular chaperone